MSQPLFDAFMEARDGWPADRVLADPELNARFIQACRKHGLAEAPSELNRKLLNMRKRGLIPRGARRTVILNQHAFGFAAEIAVRALERKHRTTLDTILCDPVLAQEFDSVATAIAPGFRPLEYRWAALRLRKSKKLSPEMVGRAVPSEVYGPIAVAELSQLSLPRRQGCYIFSSRSKLLYVGEAKDLYARVRKHLEHSDNKFLARYIWEFGHENLLIEYHVLPDGTRTDVRKAMELELIRSRRAEFNIQR